MTGCTLYDTVTISSSVTAGTYSGIAPAPFCPGAGTQIGTTAIPTATYLWSPATGLNSTTVSNPTASPTVTTTYTVSVSYPGCSTPVTDTVTATLLPTTPFDFVDQTICPSTPTNIGLGGAGNPASIANAASYRWSPSSGLSCTTCASPNANPQTTTTYTCTITFTNGCTLSDNVTVTPTFTASAKPDAVICQGQSVTLGLASVPNVTYAWSVTSGTAGSVNPTNVAQPTANPTVTSIYALTATGTGPNAGCTITDAAKVTVNVPLTITIAGNPIICAPGSTTLGYTPALNNYIYQWSPTTGVASPTSSQTVITPSTSQIYTLTQTDLTTGCNASQQVAVVVNANPITATGGTASVCSNMGTTLPLTVTSPSGTYTYSWLSTAFLSNPYIQNPITYTSTNATYTATITDNATNCQLQVNPNIVVGVCNFALTGNVFHDANGQTDNTVNSSGSITTIPSGLYASLVDGSNNIIATVLVNPDGSYNFTTVPIGNYSIVLTTNPAGSVTPMLPAGWDGTGSILGTGTGSAGATGALPNVAVSANVINANFGIESTSTRPQTYTIAHPAIGSSIPLTGNGTIASPAALSGNDLEDGVKGAGSTFTITDTSGLNGSQLLYNGSALVVPGAPISNYNPALLSIVFTGAASTDLSFDYSVTDAAGIASPSVTYSISWLVPLPVQVVYFNAVKSGQSSLLDWSTSQEVNSNYFGIERSANGNAWTQIWKGSRRR